jgi:hypothetical protein
MSTVSLANVRRLDAETFERRYGFCGGKQDAERELVGLGLHVVDDGEALGHLSAHHLIAEEVRDAPERRDVGRDVDDRVST